MPSFVKVAMPHVLADTGRRAQPTRSTTDLLQPPLTHILALQSRSLPDRHQIREVDLMNIVQTHDIARFAFTPRNCRQQKTRKNGDDRDDYEKFNQRERASPIPQTTRAPVHQCELSW